MQQSWLITNVVHYQHEWSSTGAEGSVAQPGSAALVSSFHGFSLAAGLIFSMFFFANWQESMLHWKLLLTQLCSLAGIDQTREKEEEERKNTSILCKTR